MAAAAAAAGAAAAGGGAAVADAAREAGNAAVKAGKWEEAVRHYTAAIAAAPRDERAWCNRALAYLKVGDPLLAWGDAIHVLETLNGNNVKATLRLGAACESMELYDMAEQAYRHCLALPAYVTVRADDEARERLQATIAAKERRDAAEKDFPPSVSYGLKGPVDAAMAARIAALRAEGGAAPMVGRYRGVDRDPAAVIAAFTPGLTTDAIELRWVAGRGVGVFAKRDLRADTVVHTDTPLLVASTSPVCYHCVAPLPRGGKAVACDCDRWYCSPACKAAAAAAYHAPLCSAAGGKAVARLEAHAATGVSASARFPLLMWKMMGAALVAAAATGAPLQSPSDVAPFSRLSRSTDWATPDGDGKPGFGKRIAMHLIQLWRLMNELLGSVAAEPAASIGWLRDALILIGTNVIGLNSTSQAVMGVGSFFNHSCTPNTDAGGSLEGPIASVTFTTLAAVKAGEELTIAYQGASAPLEERRTIMQAQYGFICTCPKCTAEAAAAK